MPGRGRAAVVVAALAVALASVGWSAPAGAASKKSPVKIGFECSCSGALASSIAIQAKILTGWADEMNAHGGIAGHRVDLIVSDDALNPGTSLAEVTKMVEQDHVAAIIDGSDVSFAWAKFVQQHSVPVVEANLSNTVGFSNPDFFPVGQTINTLAPSIAAGAKKAKVTDLATVYCSEDPVCAQLVGPIAKAAHAVGIKSNYAAAISASAPSYTAQCLAAKQEGANGIFVGQASEVVVSFASSCAAQGYSPTYIAEASAISSAFLKSPALEGMVGIQNDLPAFVTRNRTIKAMDAALARYVPGTLTSPDFTPYATTVWAAGELLTAAAGRVRAAAITPRDILAGLYSLHGATLGGITPPLTYHRGTPTTIACWFYMSVKGHHFEMPYGVKPSCAGR
jgi:branched-chain amino acid transport system substrate-binding protein